MTVAWSYGGVKVLASFGSHVTATGPDDCWTWTGRPNEKGYGRFTMNYKTMMAHRASYLLAFGSIPDGMCVLHNCDNPPCVNPKHLFLGTLADNNADMRAKGRGKNPPAGINSGTWTSEKISGQRHPRAKLTDSQVAELLRLADSGVTTRELSSKFGLGIRYINLLRSRNAARARGNSCQPQ